MAKTEVDPDALSKTLFVLTVLGSFAFAGSVLYFIFIW